ncbi:MAG: hypothetical protein HKN68_08810 [Saprospiraceae bacterium]|nr:hypothetical protein [Saprospiraceae bacterium]
MPTGMKEMRNTIVLLLFMMLTQASVGQDHKRSCGTEYWVDQQMEVDPEVEKMYSESFRKFNENKIFRSSSIPECGMFIPVHVVVVHPTGDTIGEGANISLEHIQSQIDVLNQDFGLYNSNAGNTPAQFSAENTGIQFCLASVDPEGNPTEGVTRYATDEIFDFGIVGPIYDTRIAIKKATAWDRDHYLNIWVAPTIGSDSDIIGFARVPTLFSHPDIDDDGVNIKTTVFGGPGYGMQAPYNMGRTTTHEIGHYFGLNHIATKNNTCSGDDGILDTPRQFRQNYGCPSHPSPSCGNNGDMFMNYMDYTDDVCMTAFTADQGAYMRELVYQLRPGLIETAHIACPEDVTIKMEIVSSSPTSCNKGNDGTIEVDACGGNNDNYSYRIDGGAVNDTGIFNGLTPGNHIITIRNDYGIQLDTVIEIMEPSVISAEVEDLNNISCNGSGDGSFNLSITGGVPGMSDPYLVSIDGGLYAPQLAYTDLQPGIYNIRVRDGNSCEVTTSVEVSSPEPLQLRKTTSTDVDCYGTNTGSIRVDGQGGTPDYTYSRNGTVYDNVSNFDMLESGPIKLWIKDMNDCIDTATFLISEPQPLVIGAEEVQEISCAGIYDAAILISTSGGTGPYQYYLDGSLQPESLIQGLGAGTFAVRVEDGNLCSETTEITIENPSPLIIDSVKTVDVLCAGDVTGSITVYASGGSEPYTYLIDGVAGDDSIFNGLNEDLYTISVIDAHACEIVSETVIITNGNLKVNEESKSIPTCSYSLDGIIEVSGVGGAGIYTYSIDGINFQDEPVFTGLGVGIYNVRINDGEECLASTIVDLRGVAPVEMESLDILNPSCYGADDGMIDFEITGGVGNYDYYLNGNYIEEDLVTGLTSGDYILEVLDGKGCRFETLISLQPKDEIVINLNEITPADCSIDQLGSVKVTADGGSGNFTYSINEISNQDGNFINMTGGDYTIQVIDDQGCTTETVITIPSTSGLEIDILNLNNESCHNASDGSFTIEVSGGTGAYSYFIDQVANDNSEINNLPAGVYDVYIQDESTCSIHTLVEILPAPSIELESTNGTPPSCHNTNDGTLRIKANGGTGNLMYSFENRDNATGVFPGVGGGNYTITITDDNQCMETFDISLNAPSRLIADDIEIMSPSCNSEDNGSIYLKAGGGTGTKSIIYDGDVVTEDIFLDDITAGNYRFNLIDQNGCTGRIDVFVEEPDQITIVDTIIIMQNQNERGSIQLVVAGGTKPYTYTIDGGTKSSEPFFDDLIEGHYDITIEDVNGCTTEARINVLYDDRFENPPGSISDVLVGYERIQNETILSFIAHGEQRIKLYVFDAGGRFIMYTEEFSLDGPNRMIIPASDFPSGIYIVRIDALRESEYLKFVKF